MKNILALALCFVFVSLAAGQSYGRVRTPKIKPVVHPKPMIHPKPLIHTKPVVHPKPIFHQKPVVTDPWTMGNPIGSLNGGGLDMLPPEIAKILGSTFSGKVIRGGMEGFPQHGGSGTDPSGLRNGWGADPNAPLDQSVSNMVGGGLMSGGAPFVQSSLQAEHNIAKEVNHAGRKNIGGINPLAGPVVNPVGHHVEKTIVGQQRHNIAKIQNHNIVKSSGTISAGKPSYLRRRPMHAGVAGHSNPAMISHTIGKASLGADSIIGHNIAKMSGTGVGFINPNGHVAEKTRVNQMSHNIAKSTGSAMLGRPIGGGYIGLSQLGGLSNGLVGHNRHGVVAQGVVGHNIAKSTGSRIGRGSINGGGHVAQKIGVNPVAHHSAKVQHNIVKSSMGGINGGGHVAHRMGVNPAAHHSAKVQHNIVKSSIGGINGGGHVAHRMGVNPAAHHTAKVQHNIVKSSIGGINGGGHVAHRIGVNPIAHHSAKSQHNIVKSSMGGINGGGHVAQRIGVNPAAHHSAKVQHNIVKSSIGGINGGGHVAHRIGVNPAAHHIAKVQHNIVKSSIGGINGGGQVAHRIGVNPIAHHSAKVQHNIVKSSTGGSNGGGHVANMIGVNPVAHQAARVQHNIVKSSIGGSNGGGHVAHRIGVNPAAHHSARVQHNIVKSSMGRVRPIDGAVNRQFGMFLEDPVHSVHKVSKSGIAAVGHDRLAANIGHGIAQQVIGHSANAVNIGSNGGVSAGNPVAVAATHGLAKESLHVAGKTLNIAASQSNPIRSNGPFGVGNNVFGGIHPKPVQPKPFHPKPVVKPPPKFPTGYGRRRNF